MLWRTPWRHWPTLPVVFQLAGGVDPTPPAAPATPAAPDANNTDTNSTMAPQHTTPKGDAEGLRSIAALLLPAVISAFLFYGRR